MLTMSTFSLLHEKNNFASQFFVIISYYRFTYEIHKRLYVHPLAMHIIDLSGNYVTTNTVFNLGPP